MQAFLPQNGVTTNVSYPIETSQLISIVPQTWAKQYEGINGLNNNGASMVDFY